MIPCFFQSRTDREHSPVKLSSLACQLFGRRHDCCRRSQTGAQHQATNLKDVVVPTLLPGILVNTSPTKYRPLTQVQLQKWDGKAWIRFGEILGA